MSDSASTHDADSPPDAGSAPPPARSAEFGTARVRLRPRKARPFFARHPWVLDSAIASVEGAPEDGDVVELLTDKDQPLARGIYNSRSRIRVRLYSWDPEQPLDDAFWRRRLERAVSLRRQLGLFGPQRAARLVFSEADGLSGLVVDAFDQHLVVQINAAAMATRLETITSALVDMLQPASVLVRAEGGIRKAEGIEPIHQIAWGTPADGPVFIREHGISYGVDIAAGQKTGFYLDQRDNRAAAARYMENRRVLDLFCYSGAFSLAASTLGKAREVHGIDSSENAIRWARANAELNGVANVRFHVQDGFEALDQLREQGEKFDAVVLDPPKFTRNRFNINDALRAYHRINRVAVDLLQPDGILVTCSCSGNVTREDFLQMLGGVAEKTRRDIQILEQRGPAADHPVNTACLENEYLKCFICRVL